METLRVIIELEVTALGVLSDEERTQTLNLIAKQVTPIEMLPYGVSARLKSVGFAD